MKVFVYFATALACVMPAQAESQSLTLTTYNIHSGIPAGYSHSNYLAGEPEMIDVAHVLTESAANFQPDIIALQEVRNQWPCPPKEKCEALDMALELAKLTKMNYAFGSTIRGTAGYPENRDYMEWGTAEKWTSSGAMLGHYGNAVLSRFAMSKPQIIKLPMAAEDDTKKDNDEPRNAVRVEIPDTNGFGPVVVYATHLQHNNGRTRARQMRALLQAAKADMTSATVFLMGDFNHSPRPGEPELLKMVSEAGFHDLAAKYSEATGKPLEPTMPGEKGATRIDYIFSSKPVNVRDVYVMKVPVSDHYPVTVVVEATEGR